MPIPFRPSEFPLEIRQALQRIRLAMSTGVKHSLSKITNPLITDDSSEGYSPGSHWYNKATPGDFLWICQDATEGVAVWINVFGGEVPDGPTAHVGETAGTNFTFGKVSITDSNTQTATEKIDTMTFTGTGGIVITGDGIKLITFDGSAVGGGAEEHIPLFDGDALGSRHSIIEKSALYSLTRDDSVVLVNASAGAVTIIPPADVENFVNFMFFIKKIDSSGNIVSINAQGNNMDGSSTHSLSSQYDSLTIISDGTQWWKVGVFP